MPGRLFGTNGIRGVVNVEIDTALVLKVAASAGTLFAPGPVLLGSDVRLSSPAFKEAAAAGLMAAGCEVIDIGLTPTPAIQFLTTNMRAKGGIVITASHNPPHYNGVKVIDSDGIELSEEKERQVEEMVFGGSWAKPPWEGWRSLRQDANALDSYVEGVVAHLDPDAIANRRLTVVVDAGNSVGALATPRILERCGCRVISLNCQLDGTFPSRQPEPVPSALAELCEAVKAYGADFGVAHDGDADRAIFVDDVGVAHWGDRTFCLIAQDFLSDHPGSTIVTPVSSTRAIQDIASKHGAKIIWTRVGSVVVSHTMKRLNAPLGGEENGGIFYSPHLPVRDGAMASAMIANLLAKTGKKLSQLLEELPHRFMLKDKVRSPQPVPLTALEKLVDKEVERVERIDGLKLWLKDGSWVLIRRSGTEPAYRIFLESPSPERADELIRKYKSALSRIVAN